MPDSPVPQPGDDSSSYDPRDLGSWTFDDRWGPAKRHTIRMLREFRHLGKWWRNSGEDPAHDLVVRMWLEHEAVAFALGKVSVRRQREWITGLLDAAERWLEDEDEQLAAVWALVTSGEAWKSAPWSAQRLYAVLHAVAGTPGKLGGPNVVMAHSWAIELIKARTGRPSVSRGTITNAREWLTGRGILTAEIGLPWAESKGKTVSTRFQLLTGLPPTELALCARTGLVQFAAEGRMSRPAPLSDKEQAMLEGLMANRRAAKAEAKAQREKQVPDPAVPELPRDYGPVPWHLAPWLLDDGRRETHTDFEELLPDGAAPETGIREREHDEQSPRAGCG